MAGSEESSQADPGAAASGVRGSELGQDHPGVAAGSDPEFLGLGISNKGQPGLPYLSAQL